MEELKIKQASFEGSYVDVDECPRDHLPEFAFIGRSNVGKSSLINMLCDRKNLVRVSHAPGKTQTINFFRINEKQFRFVDLPGYGFAKVSKGDRAKWKKFIEDYLRRRTNLACTYLLIDSRIEPQASDLEKANSLGEWEVPFCFVFTKNDSSGQPESTKNADQFLEEIGKTWQQVPPYFFTSSTKRTGKEDLLKHIFSLVAKP